MEITQEKQTLVFTREEISEIILLIGTDKGAFLYYSDGDRLHWDMNGPHFLGSIIHHIVLDPRNNKTILASIESKQFGATIYRSNDFGKTWTSAHKPPTFPNDKLKRKINHIFHITPGHDSEPNVWYAGTSPQGLFRSKDGGNNWESINGFNKNPKWEEWVSSGFDISINATKLHSILINPMNNNHIYVGMSYGGVFETTDGCKTWIPINSGIPVDHLNKSIPEFGQDSHLVVSHPFKPDRLYQQNRYGIYRIDRPQSKWVRIGDNMPADIGDIGFPIIIHPADPNIIWVFPIDKNEPTSRVSPGGQPALFCSHDSGDTWFRQDIGLPMRNAWFTILRQSLTTDHVNNAGIYFGTTSGSLWMSDNEGNSWRQIAVHLPKILSVEAGVILKNN